MKKLLGLLLALTLIVVLSACSKGTDSNSNGSGGADANRTEVEGGQEGPYAYMIYSDKTVEIIGCNNAGGIRHIPDHTLMENYPVKSIRDYAFSDCKDTAGVEIPVSVTYIGPKSFEGSNPDLVIYVYHHSYAEQYCKDNNMKYEYAD